MDFFDDEPAPGRGYQRAIAIPLEAGDGITRSIIGRPKPGTIAEFLEVPPNFRFAHARSDIRMRYTAFEAEVFGPGAS